MEMLDAVLQPIAPDLAKWATVVRVERNPAGLPEFHWHHYQGKADAVDFWPASAIKLPVAIAALERLHAQGLPLDCVVAFEHQEGEKWVLDCARGVREMCGEVFRRSSNEDYTLLLRMAGLDWLNERFLVPERGFTHSAIMRGYVTGRPYVYKRAEKQRITAYTPEGAKNWENIWSGRYYAKERGARIIDPETGNMASTRDMAECLRRLIFHAELPAEQRFRLPEASVDFLCRGGLGFSGLETQEEDSGPFAWKNGVGEIFPRARFYHKCGVISNYCLDLAYVDDRKDSGKEFLLVPVAAAGLASKPVRGEEIIAQMSRAIAQWVRGQ